MKTSFKILCIRHLHNKYLIVHEIMRNLNKINMLYKI